MVEIYFLVKYRYREIPDLVCLNRALFAVKFLPHLSQDI